MKPYAILVIIGLFCIVFNPVYGQDDKEKKHLYNEADNYSIKGDNISAIPLLKKLVELEPNNANFNFKLGYALHKSYNYESPIPYLEKAVTSLTDKYYSSHKMTSAPIKALYILGKEYQYAYMFDKAREAFMKYDSYLTSKDQHIKNEVESLIVNCNYGAILLKNPIRVHHTDMGAATAIKNYTHSPVFSPDESIYIFTADIQPDKEIFNLDEIVLDENIYMIEYNANSKSWSKPIPMNAINTTKQEASLGMSPDGKTLLIYRSDNGDGNLYYSTSDGLNLHEWTKPKKFPSPINSSFEESHITLSSDGNMAFFTSTRKGGEGGLDIYVCIKQKNGRWSKAINLGKKINSEYHEESPHIQAYGNYLYFSSNRNDGMGDFDIYRATLRADLMERASENIDLFEKNIDSLIINLENVGYPINTPRSDLFFKTSVDGRKGYYSVNCAATKGELDLNIVEFLDGEVFPNAVVKGVVIDTKKDTVKKLEVNLFDLESREFVKATNTSSSTGEYSFELYSTRKYFIAFEEDGQVYFSKPFRVKKYFTDHSFSNIIYLDPFFLKDMLTPMSAEEFIEFKQKISRGFFKRDNGNDDSKLAQIFNQLAKEKPVSLSRKDGKIPTFISNYTPPMVIDQRTLEVLTRDTANIDSALSKTGLDSLQRADSLYLAGLDKINRYRYDSALVDLEGALEIYEDLRVYESSIMAMNKIAEVWDKKGRKDIMLNYQLQALGLLEQIKDLEGIAMQKFHIGNSYFDLYEKENALEFYTASLEMFKEQQNEEMVLVLMERISDLYASYGDFLTSIDFLEQLSKMYENMGDKRKQADIYNKLGLVHDMKGNYTKAIEYFNLAIDFSKEQDDKKSLSIYLNNLGNTYYNLTQYKEALKYYGESEKIKREIGYIDGLALTLYNIGNAHMSLGDNKQALNYFKESLELSGNINDSELLSKNHFAMSTIYEIFKNFKEALYHFEEYIAVRAPYLAYKDTLQLAQISIKYEIDDNDINDLKIRVRKVEFLSKFELIKKQKRIQAIEKQNALKKQINMYLWLLLAAFMTLLMLVMLRYRTKKKLNNELKSKNAEILQLQEEISQQHYQLEIINLELEKLSLVASKTDNAVAILDSKANFEWVNTAYEQTFGVGIHQLNTKTEKSILETTTYEIARKAISECLESKTTVSFEAPRKSKGGNEIWVQTSLTPIVIDDELYKIISIDSNIDKIKKAEKEILQQKSEIEKQRDEIEGQRDLALEQKNKIEEQKNEIEKTIEELHRTQKKLVEAEKMASLGNLVAGIAHEINTPVGVGIIASTTLKTKTGQINNLFSSKKMKQSDLKVYFDTAKETSSLILSNLRRTGELVKSFKRVSVDEITEQKRKFILNEYVQDVINSLEPKLNEKKARVNIVHEKDVEMYSYPGAFAQVITNFAVNSVMHGFKREDTENIITINISKQDDKAVIHFHDNGLGMTAEVVKKAFDPFFTTNMQGGTGLGLNIVYNIVNQKLKGEVSCASKPNEGATFTVVVPLSVK